MTDMKDQDVAPAAPTAAIDRRAALLKLGLGAALAYVTPTMLKLSEARAASGGGSGGDADSSGGDQGDSAGDSQSGPTSPSGPSSST